MAHTGKYGPYGPPRDLAGVNSADIAYPPPNRATIAIIFGDTPDGHIETFGPFVSEPIGWSYPDYQFWWEWDLVADGQTLHLKFRQSILGNEVNQNNYECWLIANGTDYDQGELVAGAWDDLYHGQFSFGWPVGAGPSYDVFLTIEIIQTSWTDTP